MDQSIKSREAIREILLQDEYETETAESAEEGLDLIASRQFDVLVTDLPLSSMGRSGWLHSGPPEAADLPVVAIVQGAAIAGGAVLALSADFVVASDAAVFAMSATKIGTVPPWS
ncbi:MAG: enoyl-CoA hydratase-related protein, partial [Nitrospinota bacterium]|nr:enoyl-CoA hydratase-related protein [Nitrospinota bacterium]